MHLTHNLRSLTSSVGREVALPEDPSVRLEDGQAWLRTEGRRWVRMHSRDPLADAARQVARLHEPDAPEVVVAIGLGLGYLLDALEQEGLTQRVLAIEPVPGTLRGMLARRDWRAWLDGGRLRLLVGPDYAGATDAWRQVGSTREPLVVVHPVLARERPESVRQATAVARRALFDATANADARQENASTYLLNTLRNLPVIATEADVKTLVGRFEGVPAIVAAAGPSLERGLSALERGADRALLIAVDTAVRPLLARGIEPHVVVALDPTELNAHHLASLPRMDRACLVAEPSLGPSAFGGFAGRVFGFTVADHEPWPWLGSLGLVRGHLDVWGSVATAAFDLAVRLGCDPVILTGLDLAYPEGRPYARGVTFEEDWAAEVFAGGSLSEIWTRALESRALLDMPGVDGSTVTTASHLVAVRDWLVDRMRAIPVRRFVNVCGSGILVGDPLEQCTAEEAIAALPTRHDDLWKRIAECRRRDLPRFDRVATGARELLACVDPDREPFRSWLAFAPGTTSGDLVAALRYGATATTVAVVSATERSLRDAAVELQSELTNHFVAATERQATITDAVGAGSSSALSSRSDARLPSPSDVLALRAILADAEPHRVTLLATDDHLTSLASEIGVLRDARLADPRTDRLEPSHVDLVVICVARADDRLGPVLDAGFEHLRTDGTLVVLDLRPGALGTRLRSDLHAWLERRIDAMLQARRTDDRWTRIQVLRRIDPVTVVGTAPGAVSDRLVQRLVERYRPTRVLVLGAAAERWIAVFSNLGVGVVRAQGLATGLNALPGERYDLCLCVDAVEAVRPPRDEHLIDLVVRASDIVALCSPPPGLGSGEHANAAPLARWARLFMARGFEVTADLRNELEDAPILDQDVREPWVHVVRRLVPTGGAGSEVSMLTERLVAREARIEDLEIQMRLMRFERAVRTPPLAATPADPPVRLVDFELPAPRLEPANGHAWAFRFRSAAGRLHTYSALFQDALLEEDGRPLPRPHAYLDDIVELGEGRTALWPPRIVFAASDNSDPRTNGRRYTLPIPAHVAFLERLPADLLRRLGL